MVTTKFRHTIVACMTALLGALMVSSVASAWDGSVQGQPHQLDRGARGYFVWHNDAGWHLRTHNDEDGVTYHGVLRTDGIFRDAELVRAEGTEDLSIEDGGHTLKFRFRTYGHIDGLNVRVEGGTHVRLDLETNGHQTALERIYIGATGRHPARNPFVIHR